MGLKPDATDVMLVLINQGRMHWALVVINVK